MTRIDQTTPLRTLPRTMTRPDTLVWVPRNQTRVPKPHSLRWLVEPSVGVLIPAAAWENAANNEWPPSITSRPDYHRPIDNSPRTVAMRCVAWAKWWSDLARLLGRRTPLVCSFHPNHLGDAFIRMNAIDDLDDAAKRFDEFVRIVAVQAKKTGVVVGDWHLDIEESPGQAHELVEIVRLDEERAVRIGLGPMRTELLERGYNTSVRLFSDANRHLLPVVAKHRGLLRAKILDRVVWPAITKYFPASERSNYHTPATAHALGSIVAFNGEPDEWPSFEDVRAEIRTTRKLGSVWLMDPNNPNQDRSLGTGEAFIALAGEARGHGAVRILFRNWDTEYDWTPLISRIGSN